MTLANMWETCIRKVGSEVVLKVLLSEILVKWAKEVWGMAGDT